MRSLIDETRPWKFVQEVADDCRINPVSLPPKDDWPIYRSRNHKAENQDWMNTWHSRWIPPPPRPPRTWKQWLMPWTYPRLTSEQKWALKQFD